MKTEPPCLIDEREGGAIFERHLVWDAADRCGYGVGDLAITAAREPAVVEERHHSIAGFEARIGGRARDHAADLGAGHEWELWLHLVLPGDHESSKVLYPSVS